MVLLLLKYHIDLHSRLTFNEEFRYFFGVEVDRTFLKTRAENLVKVTRIEEALEAERTTFSSGSTIKIILSKHVVLIMRVINMIINMGDIRQERPNKHQILKLNKRLK